APFIVNSPIMGWLHALLGVQGASYVIGILELSTAAALILGAFVLPGLPLVETIDAIFMVLASKSD
ncbi:MAG: hypothetical protein JWQ79_4167, partial [Mucilaginibacter sp.]|nr:hypothetical protein [Mucilaginibacter sp.]